MSICRDDEGRSRKNFVWSHHLVVFVLDDVTVPDETTRRCIAEINHYPRDLARRAEYGILEPGFVTHCGYRRTAHSDGERWRRRYDVADLGGQLRVKGDRLTVEHAEQHLVDVNRVGVRRGVEDLPDLDRTRHRSLCYRKIIPEQRMRDKRSRRGTRGRSDGTDHGPD